ncbi:PAS domain-containing protein [Novosphingobium sp. G106]|uniref:PAS domain-containing sensor histidine kinase n=1 Tax=Novosphingobium sp. G106 TaxID=2849500 RepID=UPI001C2D1777|nr:ATP-binding protein [Novosphingobium sp. G106]MBV1692336.1 PAS domain-containing protein [Novosphingobium sp. G106]
MFLAWGKSRTCIFNAASVSLLGEDYEKALGQPIHHLWAGLWSEIGTFFDEALKGNSGLVEDLEVPVCESGYFVRRWVTFSYSPVREDGKVVGVLCICSDRTDKVLLSRQIEQERNSLYEVFEKAPGFVAMTSGPEHRFTLANASYRKIVGGRNVLGRTVAEALPEIVKQGFIEVLDNVFRSGEPFVAHGIPIRLLNPTGSEEDRYIDILYAPRFGKNGRIMGIFCEGHDVTEHVKADKMTRVLQSELIHASRFTTMGNMAATLAHEINQPLAAISNFTAAALRFLADEKLGNAAAALKEIDANTHRAGRTIRSLRTMVSKKAGTIEVFELGRILADALALARLASPSASVASNVDPSIAVAGDRVQIEQVLLNLLRNAFEAVDGYQTPRIEINAYCDSNAIVITVADNGPGIQCQPIDSVFDSFVTTKAEGLGLGLFISRTIILAHGGRLWAENLSNGGARFNLRLPLVADRKLS